MMKRYVCCVAVAIAACGAAVGAAAEKRETYWRRLTVFPKLAEREKAAAESVALDLESVKAEILGHVLALCEGEPRNFRNVKRLAQAGEHIAQAFGEAGYVVTNQAYDVQGNTYFNVIAELPGARDKPLLVVGAHYDVCGNTPGADDNASGVAVMLALAKAWKPLAEKARARVQFVAYTLEEPPFFDTDDMGSRVHAKSLAEASITPELVIVLEMLGYYNDGKKSQRYPLGVAKAQYPTTGNFLLVVANPFDKKPPKKFYSFARGHSNLNVEYIALPVAAAKFSDHHSYWRHGFSAFALTNTAWYRNPHYHQQSDTPGTLDYARLAETAQLLARFLTSQ